MATGGRHAGGATIPLAVTQIATQSQFLGNSLSAQSKLVAYFCGSMVAEEGPTRLRIPLKSNALFCNESKNTPIDTPKSHSIRRTGFWLRRFAFAKSSWLFSSGEAPSRTGREILH